MPKLLLSGYWFLASPKEPHYTTLSGPQHTNNQFFEKYDRLFRNTFELYDDKLSSSSESQDELFDKVRVDFLPKLCWSDHSHSAVDLLTLLVKFILLGRGGNVCTMSPLFKLPTNFALYCGVCKQREKLGWVKKCGIDCGEETLSRCGRGKIRGKKQV